MDLLNLRRCQSKREYPDVLFHKKYIEKNDILRKKGDATSYYATTVGSQV